MNVSSVFGKLLRLRELRVRSLASLISTGPHEILMRKIYAESPTPIDPSPKSLLLLSVSRLFRDQIEYGTVTTGHQLHCQSITLGLHQSHFHKSLITMYARELMVMQKTSKDICFLLESLSKLFEVHLGQYIRYDDLAEAERSMKQLHCLSMKLGFMSLTCPYDELASLPEVAVTRVQILEMEMLQICAVVPPEHDFLRLSYLLSFASLRFPVSIEKKDILSTGGQLMCLAIKLGFESLFRRSLINRYPSYLTKVQILEMEMLKICAVLPPERDHLRLSYSLTSASLLFDVSIEKEDLLTTGRPLMCLAIKLGFEYLFRRSLIERHPNYFSKVDILEILMHEIHTKSSKPVPRLMLLLQAVSELFDKLHFVYGGVHTAATLHGLTIKLGIETQNHRNLITLYGREMDRNQQCVRNVLQIIPRGFLYKSLNAMVHAFAFKCYKEAHAAFGMIIRLGSPSKDNIFGLIDALRTKSFETENTWYVSKGAKSIKSLMEHYGLPLDPKIVRAIVWMTVDVGLVSTALETIVEMAAIDDRLIDDTVIICFLSGCLKHEDMKSASALVRHLENTGVVYTLDEALVRHLGMYGLNFGKNLRTEKNQTANSDGY